MKTRKIKLYLVKHRTKVKKMKMLILGLIVGFSYFNNFHYELIAPMCYAWIFLEANTR